MTQLLGASRPIDQRMAYRLVRWPPIHGEQKESLGRAGALRNIKECLVLTRRPDTTPRHKSGKARIEAPMREARSSPPAHRGARVIGTDALRILVTSQESSAGEESNQVNKDDPNINAHQSSPHAGSYPLIPESTKKAPGTCSGASGSKSA